MNPSIFYIFIFLHLVFLIIGFGSVIVIDTFGLLWTLKKVPLKKVNEVASVTQRLIWIGWGGLVLSGLGLIFMKGSVDNLMTIKLFFVAMLGVNGIFLHRIKKSLESLEEPEHLPPLYFFRISLASTLSQIGWWGALIIGFSHRQISHVINFPQNPWIIISAATIIILATAAIGESLLRKKT